MVSYSIITLPEFTLVTQQCSTIQMLQQHKAYNRCLITGLECGMEQWNGMVDGHNYIYVTYVAGFVHFKSSYLPTYYVSRPLISPYQQVQCCRHTSLSGIMTSDTVRKWGFPKLGPLGPFTATKQVVTSYSNMHGTQAYWFATKVVRAGDQSAQTRIESEETEDWALISPITFLSTMTFHNYSLAKSHSCFMCESLALQH